jgi:lipopolysaccharide/colanic/teichoic acid biosynthesis glycosyltransferase
MVYRVSALDLAAAGTAPVLGLWIRDPKAFFFIPPSVVTTYVVISLCFSIWFFIWFRVALGLPNHLSSRDVSEIVRAALFSVTATAAFSFTITRMDQIPRSVPAIHFLTLLAILLGLRLFGRQIAQHRELRVAADICHYNEKNVIVVGAGSIASLYIGFLESIPKAGWRIAAILDDSKLLQGRSILGHTIVGGTEDAEAVFDDFAQHGLRIWGVAVCEHDRDRALEYRKRLEPLCRSRGLQFELLVDKLGMFDNELGRLDPRIRPVSLPRARYLLTRRMFEFVIATLSVLVFLPVLALTGLLVFTSVGSPVIFWQRRVGRNARTIFVYKFKTMRNAVDSKGRLLSADERSTRIGEILRATRLDELPQLFNVLKGDMAIIGPRPLLPVDQPADPSLRLAVAPGLTGWAQINGGKLVSVEEKNSLDEWYVQNVSLRLDVEIVWRTFLTVLRGDRRNEDQLAAAITRARKDQMQRSYPIVMGSREALSPFAEQSGRRTAG